MVAMAPVQAAPFFVGGATVGSDTKAKLHSESVRTAQRSFTVLPKVGLSWPAVDGIELGLEVQRNVIRQRGGVSVSGLGDPEAKAKIRLSTAAASPLGLDTAAEVKVRVPVEDARNGLGAGATTLEGAILLARKVAETEIGAKLGYVRVLSWSRGTMLLGVLAARRVTPKLLVGAELATEMRGFTRRDYDLSANAGAKLAMTDRLEIHAMIGRSLACGGINRPITRFKLGLDVRL